MTTNYKYIYNTIDKQIEPALESVKCYACEEDNSDIVFAVNGFEISKCNVCGNNFASVRLKKEVLNERFYKYWLPSMFLNKGEDKAKTTARENDAEFQLGILANYKNPGKILDIGAAGGTFLSVAKIKGWDIYGTDISNKCVNKAKEFYGIDLFETEVEGIKEGGFDAIVLWNTLEHLYFPLREMKHLKSLLKDDGVFLIKIPFHNDTSLTKHHSLPYHIFNFTDESLDYFVNKLGLKILEKINSNDGEIPTLITVVGK